VRKKFQTYTLIDGRMMCPYCGEVEKVIDENHDFFHTGECQGCKAQWIVINQTNEVHYTHLEGKR
jgi:hypothetical protein